MALVVFLRGVNVGGHKRFSPGALARELSDLRITNIGAAGTFVIHESISASNLRKVILQNLPFEPQIMICRAQEVLDLLDEDPFAADAVEKDITRFVTLLSKRPATLPALPLCQPSGEQWQVKVVSLRGLFALSLWRRLGRRLLYPNEVVEKHFGVPATTRNWNTIETVGRLVKS